MIFYRLHNLDSEFIRENYEEWYGHPGIGLVRHDDEQHSLIATDAGEPEDRTFDRDLSWVVHELNDAYASGAENVHN